MPVDIVLLQPESPGNIGSVARVMKNLSFGNLVLVNPCPVTNETKGFAMHARDLVEKAKIKKEMDWDSYDLVVGTTGIKVGKNPLRSYITPEDLRKRMGKGKVAIVFGRESRGLSKRELERCGCICHIPTSGDYPVMNLSHSVAIVLYELGKSKPEKDLAEQQQISNLENLFKGVIERLNYSQDKKKIIYTYLRNVIERSILSKKEASILTGLFKKIRGRV
ncbi:MAG: TrmJ/YjtD family RNA methyltransferase [archaeon]|nr:MAG: TrmJ/YjtD family RNA methyltransferase [archaeon]